MQRWELRNNGIYTGRGIYEGEKYKAIFVPSRSLRHKDILVRRTEESDVFVMSETRLLTGFIKTGHSRPNWREIRIQRSLRNSQSEYRDITRSIENIILEQLLANLSMKGQAR